MPPVIEVAKVPPPWRVLVGAVSSLPKFGVRAGVAQAFIASSVTESGSLACVNAAVASAGVAADGQPIGFGVPPELVTVLIRNDAGATVKMFDTPFM